MATDGDIDYRSFTGAQLEDALARIDRPNFPLNYARLTAALAQHRAEQNAASGREPLSRHQLKFTGDGKEYFRIWIVNLALSIATLGIYSAWAKVRKQRYFYSNTLLDGSAFGYHAEPLKILKGRLIALLFVAAYFAAVRISVVAALGVIVVIALLTPWLIVKSRIFTSRVSSWRGIRFNFRPDYRGAYTALLGSMLLAIVSFGLMYPRVVYARYKFVVSRTSFGDAEFESSPRIGKFYRAYWTAVGVTAAVGALLGVVFTAFKGGLHTSDAPRWVAQALALGGLFLNYAIVGPVLLGIMHARNLNEVLNHTTVGPHRLDGNLDATKLVGIYMTNVFLIILTAGIYTPWAQVRIARYRCESIALDANGPLAQLSAVPGAVVPGAALEELGSFFDLDFGF
ncbi:MAG TPA: YjgN family protein [Steroidobacteraceae bacterium]